MALLPGHSSQIPGYECAHSRSALQGPLHSALAVLPYDLLGETKLQYGTGINPEAERYEHVQTRAGRAVKPIKIITTWLGVVESRKAAYVSVCLVIWRSVVWPISLCDFPLSQGCQSGVRAWRQCSQRYLQAA